MPRSRSVVALILVAAGCSAGITGAPQPPAQQTLTTACKAPLQGNRYALCGHLSTASIAPPTARLNAIGSVDAVPGTSASSKHTVEGGTFHASH